jgi:hypothetical protein
VGHFQQSDKSQKALLVSQTGALVNECLLKLTEPHLADLFRGMSGGESDFTETEIHQLLNVLTAILNCLEDIFARNDLSLADTRPVAVAAGWLLAVVSCPRRWDHSRHGPRQTGEPGGAVQGQSC